MKKLLFSLEMILFIFFYCCSTSINNTILDITNKENIISGIGIHGIISAMTKSTTTSFIATAVFKIYAKDPSIDLSIYNNLKIDINGHNLRLFDKAAYSNLYIVFNINDIIKISITFPTIGTIYKELTFPPAITEFSISPQLPEIYSLNKSKEYTISWKEVNATKYWISAILINENDKYISSKEYMVKTSPLLIDNLIDKNNNIIPYFIFLLTSVNSISLPEFKEDSDIYVKGPFFITFSNRKI